MDAQPATLVDNFDPPAKPIIPLEDRILIRPDAPEEKTPGGIALPKDAQKRPARGTVIAVGDGRILDNGNLKPMSVAVGAIVLFDQYAGTDVEVEKETLKLLRESDVLAEVPPAKVAREISN